MQNIEHLAETTANFIAAMGAAATGVTVITTEGMAGRFGLTVSAVSSVSAEPPMLLCCVNRKSPAVAAMEQNGRFAVNMLGSNNQEVAEIFAGRPKSGKPYDFERHAWEEGSTGQPVLSDATASFECEIECSQDAGSHRIFIGRVVNAKRNSAGPLVYCNRAFGRVAEL
jgi:flavin reductase (DIM6/NTAB) family NADH-FMN oxidoreductase RutF